jgi:hypothetical protein
LEGIKLYPKVVGAVLAAQATILGVLTGVEQITQGAVIGRLGSLPLSTAQLLVLYFLVPQVVGLFAVPVVVALRARSE